MESDAHYFGRLQSLALEQQQDGECSSAVGGDVTFNLIKSVL
jgi:hypothetical protein